MDRQTEEYKKLKEKYPEEILLYQAQPIVRYADSPKADWTNTWAGSCARGFQSRFIIRCRMNQAGYDAKFRK